MSRHVFGWSLPPGVTQRMIDEQCEEGPCAVCGKLADYCVCPECPTCGEQGNPVCYSTGHLKLTREQVIARSESRMAYLQSKVDEEGAYLDYLREGGDFDDSLAASPDPWR